MSGVRGLIGSDPIVAPGVVVYAVELRSNDQSVITIGPTTLRQCPFVPEFRIPIRRVQVWRWRRARKYPVINWLCLSGPHNYQAQAHLAQHERYHNRDNDSANEPSDPAAEASGVHIYRIAQVVKPCSPVSRVLCCTNAANQTETKRLSVLL